MVKISYYQEFIVACINLFFVANNFQIYPPSFLYRAKKCYKVLQACAENKKDFLKSICE